MRCFFASDGGKLEVKQFLISKGQKSFEPYGRKGPTSPPFEASSLANVLRRNKKAESSKEDQNNIFNQSRPPVLQFKAP